MIIYALIGKSGTGKSHRAQNVSKEYGIEYIIDDGLLIKGNRVLTGTSAKREATRLAAIRRAVFFDEVHRDEVIKAIGENNPNSILILGTSDNMVERIAKNLCLPPIDKRIYIEDIASQREIEIATRIRKEQGKHVIPVPTFAIKKDFSGYFIDSIKNFTHRDRENEDTENTVVRPTYSYLGKYTISSNVIKMMVAFAGEEVKGIHRVLKVNTKNNVSGLIIDMDISADMGYPIQEACRYLKEHVKKEIEYMTGFNILEINIYVRGLNLERQ